MNTLSKLQKIVAKKAKRLGRGSGNGKGDKCGKGTTRHQKAREDISLFFEGGQGRLTKKFPLLRGKGRNKSVYQKPEILKLTDLKDVADNAEVDLNYLVDNKFVSRIALKNGVKIVDGGEFKKTLIIKLPISKSAKERVEKAGGKVIL